MRGWMVLIGCCSLLCQGAEPLAYWRLDDVNGLFDGSNLVEGGVPLKVIAGSGANVVSYRQAQSLVPGADENRPLRRTGNRGSLYLCGGAGQPLFAAEGVGRFLDLTQPFTLEGWFRLSDRMMGEGAFLAVQGEGCGWRFGLRRMGERVSLFVRIDRDGKEPVRVDFPETDFADRMAWRAVALLFDPGRETSPWRAYVDGRLCDGRLAAPETVPLRGVHRFLLGNVDGKGGFHGELDLWRVSRGEVALSEQLYAYRTQPVAFWPLAKGGDDSTGMANRARDDRFGLTVGPDGGVSFEENLPPGDTPDFEVGLADALRSTARHGCFAFKGGIGVRSLLVANGLGSFCEWARGFTVEGWFKKRGDPDDRHPWQLVGARDDANGWSLFLGRNSEGAVCFSLYVNDVSAGGEFQFEKPFRQIDLSGDEAWHHVALVCDPSIDSAGAWMLFLDGVWQGTIRNPSRSGRCHRFPDLYLGGRPSYSNSFVGRLRCWRVSDGPLPADAFLCAVPESPRAVPTEGTPDPRDLRRARVLGEGPFSKANPAVAPLSDNRFIAVTTEWNETTKPRVVARICRVDGEETVTPVTVDPHAAWATLYRTRFGRIYLFFLQPTDVTLPDSEQIDREANQQGWWAFRYSDDEGKSWSEKSYRIPLRLTEIDNRKPWRGEPFRFWSVAKPVEVGMETVLAFTKIGSLTANEKEGWVVRSRHLQNERNPDLIKFEMFPEGGRGIRHPEFGTDQDRHQLVPLDGERLMCLFQTVGNPAQAVSPDGGVHWGLPERMVYREDAPRPIACGHAAPTVFRTGEERYALLFPNRSAGSADGVGKLFYAEGRGTGRGGIVWSEPELFCYGAELDSLDWLATGDGGQIVAVDGENRLLAFPVPFGFGKPSRPDVPPPEVTPETFAREATDGVSIVLTVAGRETVEGGVLFSTMDGCRGIRIVRLVSRRNAPVLQIALFDGDRSVMWQADESALALDGTQTIAFICDFRAGYLSVVSQGRFRDGDGVRPRGWGVIPPGFGSIAARSPKCAAAVHALHLYNAPLTTAQAVRLTTP